MQVEMIKWLAYPENKPSVYSGDVDEDTQLMQLGYIVTNDYTFMVLVDGNFIVCDALTADEVLGLWEVTNASRND